MNISVRNDHTTKSAETLNTDAVPRHVPAREATPRLDVISQPPQNPLNVSLSQKSRGCELTIQPPISEQPLRLSPQWRFGPSPHAFVLSSVLTSVECEALISRAETQGFAPAMVTDGDGQQTVDRAVRNNDRCTIVDADFASMLWLRIKAFVPPTIERRPAVGISQRLSLLKYGPGQEFKPHLDNEVTCADGSGWTSKLTVQLYLNDDFSGGATVFLDGKGQVEQSVQPVRGAALVFQQDLLHSGQKVLNGNKYSVRTDVLFGEASKFAAHLPKPA